MIKATRGGLYATSVRTRPLLILVALRDCGTTWKQSISSRIPRGPSNAHELSLNSPQHVSTGVRYGGTSENDPRASSHHGKTKFQQHWLDGEDSNGDVIRHYILPDKDDKYKAICSVCYTSLKVDNAGKHGILQHARTIAHKKRMSEMKRCEIP